jgi:hypothetical protein
MSPVSRPHATQGSPEPLQNPGRFTRSTARHREFCDTPEARANRTDRRLGARPAGYDLVSVDDSKMVVRE